MFIRYVDLLFKMMVTLCDLIHSRTLFIQAFPYVYIPYEGSLDPKELQTNIIQIGISINRALSIAYNRRYPSDPKSNFLASIILVKGIPFYGYHSGYEYFMKIYLIDPSTVSKLAELFDSGAIMGKRIQVHEAHIPFLLQFLIDYNLYGMGFIHLKDMRFREPFYGRFCIYLAIC